MYTRLVTIFLLVTGCLVGGAYGELPEAPSSSTLVHREQIQDRGRRHKNVRLLAMAFQASGLIIDGATTAQIPGQHWHGDPLQPCVEAWSPRLYGREPSAPRVAIVMGLEFAGTQAVAWAARRGVFGQWLMEHDYLIMMGNGAAHWVGGVHNLTGGCR